MAQQINLFNPIFLKQKKYFSAVTMLQSLGLVLAGVLAFYGYTVYSTQAQSRIAANSAQQLASQSQQVAALASQGRSRVLQDELAQAQARLRQREETLALLRTGGLGNTAGFARYLTALAHESVGGVWLTGFSISGDEAELHLNGRVLQADLVPAYLRALNREEVMRGRRIAELRLTAREERDASTAAPGANPSPAGASPAAPAVPNRYVEFNVIALRTAAGSPEAPAKAAQ
ncbi:MAG TPA: MSHA biogenesis protein MshI [Burkholderiales bacterium]|jgi:Tfp pilus assembly protein PilN|nr:MSHA biogenesis protein MshI [Burkholderiales bacterium]